MNFCLRIFSLVLLVTATFTQDGGFDLSDALGPDSTPVKPKEQSESPKKSGSDGGLDLSDAFGPDPTPAPKKPSSGDSGGFGFDLEDALKPGPTEKPRNPGYNPSGGGGGSFDDSDLGDVSKDGYKPDDSGRAVNPGYDDQGGADNSQAGSSGPIAGIISAVGVALVGAASSYFAYQKKKLCFKLQGGADPEKGHRGGQSNPGDNQIFSNLLRNN